MNNKIISTAIMSAMLLTPCMAFTQDDTYSDNYTPHYEYPVPTNNYQTQGYKSTDGYDDYNLPYTYDPKQNTNVTNATNNNTNNNDGQYRGRVIFVPAQTVITALTTSTITTETARAGDSVFLNLPSDFYYNNELIAPANSKIQGTVIKAGRGTYGSKNGKLQIRFTQIVTPSGHRIPLTASIETEDGSGVLKAGTIKDSSAQYFKNALIGAASGAVLGVITGAIGGNVGRGTIAGTAAGGAMGLMNAIWDKGDNVEIPQNAQINIILDQPLTMTPNNSY